MKVAKYHQRVLIKTHRGEIMEGNLFVGDSERLTDMLNTSNQFIAFEREDGQFIALSKSAIASIQPKPANIRREAAA